MKQKKNMKTYQIICTTDPYHANRHFGFVLNEKRTRGIKVMRTGLSLENAQKELLHFFCTDAGRYFPNWGVAVNYKGGEDITAYPTRMDGTRAYENDIYKYEIEEEV